MDDLVTYALLTASAVFVVLSVVLLARYRQASQRISASFDLGHDLWEALENRLKKQDERILDMMARVEVIQSRAVKERTGETVNAQSLLGLPAAEPVRQESLASPAVKSQESREPIPQITPVLATAGSEILRAIESRLSRQEAQIMEMLGRLEAVQSFAIQRANPSVAAQGTLPPARRAAHVADITTRDLIQMLTEKPRTSGEIRERFGITREHAARLLKGLFDKKLVVRNDANKPYVYELTDAGRQLLSGT
jgi:predicted transcriptional regulator